MSDRCEPPEHLRGVDGWHWVDRHGLGDKELIPWRQNPANGDFEWWYDRGGARFISGQSQTASYWNYIAPVTPPAEVDALRAEVADTDRLLLATQEDLGNAQAKAQHWATRVTQVYAEANDIIAWLLIALNAQQLQGPSDARVLAVTARNERRQIGDIIRAAQDFRAMPQREHAGMPTNE